MPGEPDPIPAYSDGKNLSSALREACNREARTLGDRKVLFVYESLRAARLRAGIMLQKVTSARLQIPQVLSAILLFVS
jgi:hypothetical protein